MTLAEFRTRFLGIDTAFFWLNQFFALLKVVRKENQAVHHGWKTQRRCNQQIEPHLLLLDFA